MARAATTADPFNAIAEPRRRQVLDTLSRGDKTVGEIVDELGWPQPQVSKHLGVLREVGLVKVERMGRFSKYSVDGERLRGVYDWVKTYERFWEHQLDRIKILAERMAKEQRERDDASNRT